MKSSVFPGLRNTRRAARDGTAADRTNLAVSVQNSEATESERTDLRGDDLRQQIVLHFQDFQVSEITPLQGNTASKAV
jgi:hypothetical protein